MSKEIIRTEATELNFVNDASALRLSDGLDGIINLDTDLALRLDFTSDKYAGYLWKSGDSIIISFIVSRRRGNFKELVRNIHSLGFTVKVPTPLGRMQEIVRKNGYKHTNIYDKEMSEYVEVWELPPTLS